MKSIYTIGLGTAAALVICLFPMPYGYYTLVRFAAMIYFGCLAFIFYNKRNTPLTILSGATALTSNPLSR